MNAYFDFENGLDFKVENDFFEFIFAFYAYQENNSREFSEQDFSGIIPKVVAQIPVWSGEKLGRGVIRKIDGQFSLGRKIADVPWVFKNSGNSLILVNFKSEDTDVIVSVEISTNRRDFSDCPPEIISIYGSSINLSVIEKYQKENIFLRFLKIKKEKKRAFFLPKIHDWKVISAYSEREKLSIFPVTPTNEFDELPLDDFMMRDSAGY